MSDNKSLEERATEFSDKALIAYTAGSQSVTMSKDDLEAILKLSFKSGVIEEELRNASKEKRDPLYLVRERISDDKDTVSELIEGAREAVYMLENGTSEEKRVAFRTIAAIAAIEAGRVG